MQVLLVEDADDYARMLMVLLEKEGIKVRRLKTGEEALDFLRSNTLPPLLITDVMMPGISGFELLAKLKEEKIMPLTIVLTGQRNEEDVLRGISLGAIDYITKPFSPAVVVAKVKAALFG